MDFPTYQIYKIQWHLAFQDSSMTQATCYHTNLFIETSPDGSGMIHEVNGDISSANGMTYQDFLSPSPESIQLFYQRTLLGKINIFDMEEVREVLKNTPAPLRQRWFNPKSMKVEACRPDGTPYREGEEVPGFWKSTEWTNEKAIPALMARRLIKVVDGEGAA